MTIHVDESGAWSAAYGARKCPSGHYYVTQQVECPVCAIKDMCHTDELRAINLILRNYLSEEQRGRLATMITPRPAR